MQAATFTSRRASVGVSSTAASSSGVFRSLSTSYARATYSMQCACMAAKLGSTSSYNRGGKGGRGATRASPTAGSRRGDWARVCFGCVCWVYVSGGLICLARASSMHTDTSCAHLLGKSQQVQHIVEGDVCTHNLPAYVLQGAGLQAYFIVCLCARYLRTAKVFSEPLSGTGSSCVSFEASACTRTLSVLYKDTMETRKRTTYHTLQVPAALAGELSRKL